MFGRGRQNSHMQLRWTFICEEIKAKVHEDRVILAFNTWASLEERLYEVSKEDLSA